MASKSLQLKWREPFLTLDMAIGALNLAKDCSSGTPARAVFGSVSVLLTMIRVLCFLFWWWASGSRFAGLKRQ